jgi:hypothetical protein
MGLLHAGAGDAAARLQQQLPPLCAPVPRADKARHVTLWSQQFPAAKNA